jgi:hypothetical protein
VHHLYGFRSKKQQLSGHADAQKSYNDPFLVIVEHLNRQRNSEAKEINDSELHKVTFSFSLVL